MLVWSYGGGVQSVAIGVLVREGVLPRPDLTVIADTGRERRTTWDYMRDVMQPYLNPVGVKIEVASHDLSRVDMYSPSGLPLAPVYTGEGRLPGYCSGEWKRDVVNRWLRLQGVENCDCWIGFSMDEIRRVSEKDRRQWCRQQFPLIDRMINRAMCRSIITAAGLPIPHKSRCWMCPHQDEKEWQEVYDDPEEWTKAVAADEEIRANDPEQKGLYLYAGRVPLAMANFGSGAILPPARPCESGFCWT